MPDVRWRGLGGELVADGGAGANATPTRCNPALGKTRPDRRKAHFMTILRALSVLATLSLLVLVAALPPTAEARSGHGSGYCVSCARDNRGHIARSLQAREEFMRQTGYLHGRPGYVVDHIVPLKRGGADAPSNMQWQTKSDAHAKDRWE